MNQTTGPSGKVSFDPLAQEYIADPAGVLRDARRNSPVFYSEKMHCWVFTRFADVHAALMDHQTFSNVTLADAPVPKEYQGRVPVDFFAKSFNALDPPEHNPVRKAGHSGFTRERMDALAASIRKDAEALIDGFKSAGSCELMGEFCHELSHRTITSFLGLPQSDIPRLKQLAEDLPRVFTDHLTPMPADERLQRWDRVADLRDYFRSVVVERRKSPSSDFVSMLIDAKDESNKLFLSDDRIVTHMTEIVFAGTDTTANLIASAVIFLDRNPSQLEAVKAKPDLIAPAIEEVLRIRGSVNGLFRRLTKPMTVEGQTLPAGSTIYLAIASANQDSAQFDKPETFDVLRNNASQHVAFGRGRHLCVGAPLARLEARIALTALLGKLPGLRLQPEQRLKYDPILLSVMLQSIRVEW